MLNARIKEIREQSGLTQEQLVAIINRKRELRNYYRKIDKAFISHIESGEKNPSLNLLHEIAEALNCIVILQNKS